MFRLPVRRCGVFFFLEQAKENKLVLQEDRKFIWQKLLATIIRPMVTAEWWRKEMDVIEQIVNDVPCYRMLFDESGAIVPELARFSG